LVISTDPIRILNITELVQKNMKKLKELVTEEKAVKKPLTDSEFTFPEYDNVRQVAKSQIANEVLRELQAPLVSDLKEVSDYKYALEEATIIAITDRNGIIKKVNNNFCKISKFTEEELIGKDHRIINSGYHTKAFFYNLWATINKGKIWKGEVKNKAKDGTIYWVDTTIVPFLDEKGKPYQYLAIRTDITDRKEAEAYLIQRTAELGIANEELAHQNNEKGNRQAELLIANEELAFQNEEKENRAAELVIANKELEFQNNEKENRAAELVLANIELAFQNTEKGDRHAELLIANVELAYQNDEKEKRAADLIQLSANLKSQKEELKLANNLLMKQEEKVRIINQQLLQLNLELEKRVEDRTRALAESEIRFRTMMETIPQIAWTNTIDGHVTFYNQRWYEYTGLDRRKTKMGGLEAAVHPDDLENAVEQYKSITKNSEGGEFQIRGKRADGLYLWQLIRLMPICSEDGTVQLWVGTATDIQELKLLQQQKDDFISIASHELKTPITSLKATLQLLDRMKENPSSTMSVKLIGLANKSLDKVGLLIQDLLNASKVNDGQLHLNKKQFLLSSLIDECCLHVRTEGIYTIRTECDHEIEVFADEGRIDQIMVNFVNNAMKYAPQSKDIMIKIEKVDVMAKISVIDEGPGISPEKLPFLFDRYYRADSSGSQYSGLGLGLYICSEIIKKHDGKIGVESELGKGSTFWFTIPII
jgi:PAS domain S-box-containing protein